MSAAASPQGRSPSVLPFGFFFIPSCFSLRSSRFSQNCVSLWIEGSQQSENEWTDKNSQAFLTSFEAVYNHSQSRKRKFLHGCVRSLGASWRRPAQPPGPVCAPAPGPCMELPPASAGAPRPGPVRAPLVLYRDTRSRLYSTAGSCKDSSAARGWPQRPRFPVVCVGHPMLGADGGGEWGGQGGRGAPLPTPVLALWEALGPWETQRASLRHPLPSAPRHPSLISSDSGWEAGKAGASVVERLLGQAQRWFSFLCYIWRLMSQEWLPRGETPKGAGCR